MLTLSIFPRFLDFGLFSPFIIRIVVAVFILHLGRKIYKGQFKWFSLPYFVAGIMIFVGLYTQVVALFGIALLKTDFYLDYWKNRATVPIQKVTYYLYFLATAVLLSLLFTGPGLFAFDYPL